MEYKEYQRRVLARASHRWYNEKLDINDMRTVLDEFIEAGNKLDRVKKALMYGREFMMYGWEKEEVLPVEIALFVPSDGDQRIIHAILGHATEGVEMIEALHAYMFGEDDKDSRSFDLVNLQEEFGDAEWYRALFLDAVGQTHEENLLQNDAKLEKRFGSTFTEDAANNRDLEAERNALEG